MELSPNCFGSLQHIQMQAPYTSSHSSAETLVSLTAIPSCHETIDPELPACWRRSEVEDAVKAKNWQTISRLRRYRPFTNEFVDAQNLHTILFTPFLPSAPLIPEGESIHTAMLEIEDEDTLAEILDEQLWAYFCTVPFEHWIQKALGLSPGSIMSLEMLFFRLNRRLRRFIFNVPNSAEVQEKFHGIAKVTWLRLFVESKLTPAQILKENPFAIVISSACGYTTYWPTVDFAFILNPLQKVLSQHEPVSRIMQQLDILAVRFQRHYSDHFLDRQRAFDIDTPLLTLLDQPIASAVLRTGDDLKEFRKLEDIDFSSFGHDEGMIPLSENMLLKSLGARWNSLCEAVEECAAVPELRGRLMQYAKVEKPYAL